MVRRGSQTTAFDIYWSALSDTLQERPLKTVHAGEPYTHIGSKENFLAWVEAQYVYIFMSAL